MHLHSLSIHLALGLLVIGETVTGKTPIAPMLPGRIEEQPAIVSLQPTEIGIIAQETPGKLEPVLGYEPPPDIGKPKRTSSSGGRFT